MVPIEIKIPKEIRNYHENIFFGLNTRQFVCSLLALVNSTPIEQRIRLQDAELNRKKKVAEKKIKAAQHKQQRYEEEIVRCLDGQSAFSESTLARLIRQAEAEVQQAKNEYTALLKDDSGRDTIQKIRKYYDEFLGWANEFDLASVPRKRTILAQLLERVEVGKGYKVKIVVKGSYRQFLAEKATDHGAIEVSAST